MKLPLLTDTFRVWDVLILHIHKQTASEKQGIYQLYNTRSPPFLPITDELLQGWRYIACLICPTPQEASTALVRGCSRATY